MNIPEFYEKYGNQIKVVNSDNAEYGEHLILHPEEIDLAKKLQSEGCIIVSVHESQDDDDDVDITQPVDFDDETFKYGYFAITGTL